MPGHADRRDAGWCDIASSSYAAGGLVADAVDICTLVPSDRTLRPVGHGIVSALATEDAGAPYDRKAAIYDRIIGGRRYNRVVWGTDVADYPRVAAEALAASTGAFLDAGCGSAVFTAGEYRRATRPLVLVDRSIGMLERAATRLEGAPVSLVQADLLDLPFAERSFATVGCFGLLHVLDDPWAALVALREQMAPGARMFASMLVAERPLGRRYLAALHRAGEVSRPRRAHELKAAAESVFGLQAEVRCTGSMAWLRASVR